MAQQLHFFRPQTTLSTATPAMRFGRFAYRVGIFGGVLLMALALLMVIWSAFPDVDGRAAVAFALIFVAMAALSWLSGRVLRFLLTSE